MQATFSVQDRCATIHLDGRLDMYAYQSFHAACQLLHARQDIDAIALDFAALDYIDSTGLGMLLVLHRETETRAIPIRILNCPAHVRRVMGYANFTQLFQIMPD